MVTFQEAVKAALPHAAQAQAPILRGLRIEPGRVLATDKFTAIRVAFDYTGDPFEPFVLAVPDAKELTAYEGTPVIEGTATFTYSDQTVRTGVIEGEYPPIDRLWPDDSDGPGVPRVAFSPVHLRKFDKVQTIRGKQDRNEPLVFTFGATPEKPVRVTFADWIDALIVPVRMAK